MRFGIGLFSLASTAFQPRHWALAHQDLQEYAVLMEGLGYDELWFSEHHFFYDGQTPAPLVAAASALAVTEHLRVGTGILLLPLRDPVRLADVAQDLNERSGGRLDLGVGQGFRDIEFDGHGVAKRDRLRRFLAGLDVLEEREARGGPRVLVGANTAATVARAASRNRPVLVSALNSEEVCRELVSAHRHGWEEASGGTGLWPGISAYRNIWLTELPHERAAALDWVRASYVQYAGLGLSMASRAGQGELDFAGNAEEALRIVVDTTITGSTDEVVARLQGFEDLGFEQIAFRLVLDGAPRQAVELQMERLAAEVMPRLRKVVV